MALILIAVVFALVLGHFVPTLGRLRRYDWFLAWLRLWDGMAARSVGSARLGVLLAIGLPVLVVAVMQTLLWGHFYGLPTTVFALVTLFYAWGPRDLDVDVEAVVNASSVQERYAAVVPLFPEGVDPVLEGPSLVEAVFQSALVRWFGVLFWFLLLGPAGAILYRLVAVSAQRVAPLEASFAQRPVARTFLMVLDWPVAHVMTLGLALAANFDSVFAAWRDWHANAGSSRLGVGFLGAAARASVVSELVEEGAFEMDGPAQAPALLELRDAMSLIWRILLMWLAVLAVFVVAGYVN